MPLPGPVPRRAGGRSCGTHQRATDWPPGRRRLRPGRPTGAASSPVRLRRGHRGGPGRRGGTPAGRTRPGGDHRRPGRRTQHRAAAAGRRVPRAGLHRRRPGHGAPLSGLRAQPGGAGPAAGRRPGAAGRGVRSRVRGGLLLIDDVQWADPATLAALPLLAAHCRVVVSLRTPHRLPPAAERALRAAAAGWLTVPPLGADAARALVHRVAPAWTSRPSRPSWPAPAGYRWPSRRWPATPTSAHQRTARAGRTRPRTPSRRRWPPAAAPPAPRWPRWACSAARPPPRCWPGRGRS